LKERIERSAEGTDRVQSWLKTEQAKQLVRRSPDLKGVFSGATRAAKKLSKEQTAALSADESALGEIKSQLAAFPVR